MSGTTSRGDTVTDNATPTTSEWKGESAVPGLHEKPPMTNATSTTEAAARDEGLVRLRGELDVVLFSLRNGPHLLTLSAVRDAVDPFLARLSAAEAEREPLTDEQVRSLAIGESLLGTEEFVRRLARRVLVLQAERDAAMAVVEAAEGVLAELFGREPIVDRFSRLQAKAEALAAAVGAVRKEGA